MKIFTPVSAIQCISTLVLGEGSFGRTATLLGAGFRLSSTLQFGTWLQHRGFLNSVTPQKRHLSWDSAWRKSRGRFI